MLNTNSYPIFMPEYRSWHTKEDGYREILNRYLYSHKGITYKELLVKCKDKKTNPLEPIIEEE